MKTVINQYDSEGREHGVWEDYYGNGSLHWRCKYHHGKEHGLEERYRENGTLIVITEYKYGEKHGVYKVYNEKERILEIGRYFKGEMDGKWETYSEDGALWWERTYHKRVPGKLWKWGNSLGKKASKEYYLSIK